MKKRLMTAAGMILSAGLLVISTAQHTMRPAPDYDKLAASIVNQGAAVREGEVVLITGSVRDAELMEDIAVQVRKLGGHPLVTISSDRLTRRMFTDVDARYDSQEPKLD